MKDLVVELINTISNKREFFEVLTDIALNRHEKMEVNYRRQNGIYYTHIDVAQHMTNELIDLKLLREKKDVLGKIFLEPCVGIGVFVFSYLESIRMFIESADDYAKVVNNIYVSDVDQSALEIFSLLLKKYSDLEYKYILSDGFFETNLSNGLLYDLNSDQKVYISLDKAFPKLKQKVDVIITNPPYRNLKAERNKYSSIESFNRDRDLFKWISSHSKNQFDFNRGVLNIYKLFVEDILVNYSSENALISLLIPSTIFTDQTCSGLRNLLFEYSALFSVNLIKENNSFFEATQALGSILVKKGNRTDKYRICKNYLSSNEAKYEIIKHPKISGLNNAVLFLSSDDEKLKEIMEKHPKLKELDFIKNLRGELDLTSHRVYINRTQTKFKLLRGRNIKLYNIDQSNDIDYVDSSFLSYSPKSKYVEFNRIACQQVSNMAKEQRLVFSFVPCDYILGNSCNFIYLHNNNFSVDYYYLLGLLNSNLLNWYFKINSSNNHISNYEINELPIPIEPLSLINKISTYVRDNMIEKEVSIIHQEHINTLVSKLFTGSSSPIEKIPNIDQSKTHTFLSKFTSDFYSATNIQLENNIALGLLDNKDSIDSILLINAKNIDPFSSDVAKLLINKYRLLYSNSVLNHTGFKLSELDLEMVRCVPQGGNWKNISLDVAMKSKRLLRIIETGGRTTLYGRLDYNKPSYTITTYFNRPGNGTYIHPIYDRVISVREAARLQSFSDDYYFVGNKTDLLNQVGNAVPPLLASAIANKILKFIDIKYSIDLFSGAGGMTLGFKNAGIQSIVGVDFDRSACLTLKVNNPEINVIHGDLTLESTKIHIQEIVKNLSIDLVSGGPPCQGFSHAGKRFIDDPRNKLFREYWDVLKRLKPKVFVMENVEGLRTMQGGLVYKEIIESFEDLGYSIEGKVVISSDFGVPQKRKRIIIIGVLKELKIDPTLLFPDPIPTIVTTREAIGDLEFIECNENSEYKKIFSSPYIDEMRKKVSK